MKHKQGFTLTEILLAVMVVGIIGIALASLTTAASREAGTGRSRVMLRNNLSVALRQLRQDVHEAGRIIYVKGPTSNENGPLLVLAGNVDLDGNALSAGTDPKYIAYCFTAASLSTTSSGDSVQPTTGSARDGGIIRRVVSTTTALTQSNACDTTGNVWLNNVKFIAASEYPVPLFDFTSYDGNTFCRGGANEGQCAILDVKLIVELNSLPVVNEAVEERILVSNGGGVITP